MADRATELSLEPVSLTTRLLEKLERTRLIKRARCPRAMKNIRKGDERVEVVYSSAPVYGPHKLICVGKNITEIRLNYHSDNEEIILGNGWAGGFKPLFMVMATRPAPELRRIMRSRRLTTRDFLAIELKHDHCWPGFLTVLKNTVHCEVTVPGEGHPPVFFVTEPRDLKMRWFDLKGYHLRLS